MIVEVHVETGTVGMREPGVFTSFQVESDAAADIADGDESWESAFAGMLTYAATKGWLSADSQEILAHVERR